jgi:hypothetical protein
MTSEDAGESGDSSYQERLGRTLRLRDVAALRSFLLEQAQSFGDERQVQAIRSQPDLELDQIMHRMILARADLADLHAASRAALGTNSALPEHTSRPRRRRR